MGGLLVNKTPESSNCYKMISDYIGDKYPWNIEHPMVFSPIKFPPLSSTVCIGSYGSRQRGSDMAKPQIECFELHGFESVRFSIWSTSLAEVHQGGSSVNPGTKNLDFRGFDSSMFSSLRGWIPGSIANFPWLEIHRLLVCGFVVCGLAVELCSRNGQGAKW